MNFILITFLNTGLRYIYMYPNKIQNIFFVYIICVYTMYIYYVYKYKHKHMHVYI